MMNARLEELRSKFQENPRRYFAPYANELRKAGDPAQAIAVCRTHLAGQPGHISGHIVLGQALYEAGEAREARDVFTAALALDPENLIALRSLGEIAQVDGEFGTARQWYERLLDADPRNTEVTQLLRDIPAETSARSAVAPDAAATSAPLPEALPDGASAESEPPQTPSFHTTFTGSGPAYRSAETEEKQTTEEDPTQEPARAEWSDFAPPAQVARTESDVPTTESMEAAVTATESFEVVDTDAHQQPEHIDRVAETLPLHESFETPDMGGSHEDFATDTESVTTQASEVDAEIRVQTPVNEAEVDTHDETVPPTPTAEAARATFAEHGFEGPVDDQIGWMTTPSAALSDLESAPEDWFDEPVAAEPEQALPESQAQEAATAEQATPDSSTDSWFDEVEGASEVAATEVSTEEFWLPPELPQMQRGAADQEQPVVSDVDVNAAVPASVAAEPAVASEYRDPVEDEAEEPVAAARDIVQIESESYATPATAGDVDHASAQPMLEQATSEWAEPVEPEPAHAESIQTVEPEPGHPHWAEPSAPEPAETARWQETVESEPVEAARARDRGDADFVAEDSDQGNTEIGEQVPALAEQVIGHTPGSVDAIASPPPAPFVTETLAELYLQQGFREEALSIYRQLVERDPTNEALRLRTQAIEQGVPSEVSSSPDAPVESRAASQSVRTFFSRLARRPAVTVTPGSTPPQSGTSRSDPEVPFAAAASALANLFSASKPPAPDEGAAATLAGAFSDPAGRPSRAADRELSLDHLFRDVPPGGAASAGVSLDEFYASPIAPPGSPTEPGEAAGSAETGGTDIRQFTAWLEGLRKK